MSLRDPAAVTRRPGLALVLLVATAAACAGAQPATPPAPTPAEVVRAIVPPRKGLPAEETSAAVTRFSFIVYGDTRGRKDGVELQQEHSLVVDSMIETIRRLKATAHPVRFVLQTGDAVVDGRDARQWNVSFVDLINRLTTAGGVPYFLAPGNHDVTSAPIASEPLRQEGLRNYLDAVGKLIPPDGAPRRLAGYPTYAFGYGNLFVIALDSNIAADDRQYEWVKAQLEGLDRKRYVHVVVFFHHPTFSSGPHGGPRLEAPTAEMRGRYMSLFRRQGVAILFSGHDHVFEHWVERYTKGSRRRRLDHVVTGGGGAPPYEYTGEPDVRDYLKANEAGNVSLEHLVRPGPEPGDNPYHYVVVRVDGARLRIEVVGVDWGRGFQPYPSPRMDLWDKAP